MGLPAARLLRGATSAPDTSDGSYVRPRRFEVGASPVEILDRNPDRIEAWLENLGGSLELPVDLGAGDRASTPLPQTVVIDSASVAAPQYAQSTFKSFALIIDAALAWAVGGQATAQLIVGRSPWGPSSGAATAVGGANQNFLKGAAANLGGAAATSLAVGLWPFSPADFTDLQWQWPYVGLELKFPSALTAGQGRLFLDMPGGPIVLIGTDQGIAGRLDRSDAFVVVPGAPPMRIATRRSILACTPAGTADLRVWENVRMGNDQETDA
jgi:hypothetical protein